MTKSYTGALAGIALADGCLTSIDEPMMTYFPELLETSMTPPKEHLAVQQLLQKRQATPERNPPGNCSICCTADSPYSAWSRCRWSEIPGSGGTTATWPPTCSASSLPAPATPTCGGWRAIGRFAPLGAFPGPWSTDWDGYQYGSATLRTTARDIAKFGQSYLDDSLVDGEQVVPAEWIEDSWQVYSPDA